MIENYRIERILKTIAVWLAFIAFMVMVFWTTGEKV